jgi:Uma2 family endonuclease
MVDAAERTRMTPAEYLAFERTADTKHDFWDGDVFAMAGASPRHNAIVANLLALLDAPLAGGPCRAFASDLKVHARATGLFTYPDVTVICGPVELLEGTDDVVTNPRLVLEVLSPSTERYDRGTKATSYRTIPSLTDYLLVAQDHHVEHFARQGDASWLLREAGGGGRLRIASVGFDLLIDEVYRRLP